MYSVTQTTNYASLAAFIVLVLKYFGIEMPVEDVLTVIAGAVIFISLVTSIINRFSKGDVTIAGKIVK